MASLPNSYTTLTAMITPALFLTANGSLIISTSNRMSRIVDRIRTLNDLFDRLDRGAEGLDFVDQRRAHVAEQLDRLEWRSDRVRWALALLYVALSAFVGTSLTLALDALFGSPLWWVPTLLAVAGVSLLLAASINLSREAHAALAGNRQEVRFYRQLALQRRQGPVP